MKNYKLTILKNICYTELVYGRINKKLGLNLKKQEIESLILKILNETNENDFLKTGKNIYVHNHQRKIRLTINSFNCRIITVDRLD